MTPLHLPYWKCFLAYFVTFLLLFLGYAALIYFSGGVTAVTGTQLSVGTLWRFMMVGFMVLIPPFLVMSAVCFFVAQACAFKQFLRVMTLFSPFYLFIIQPVRATYFGNASVHGFASALIVFLPVIVLGFMWCFYRTGFAQAKRILWLLTAVLVLMLLATWLLNVDFWIMPWGEWLSEVFWVQLLNAIWLIVPFLILQYLILSLAAKPYRQQQ
ncbi:hypothetical protein [Brackiella oedipodis]|uniref:hypothetical protein n=1 Tax=Brackiella oedipodis TaxID=124225 RepID=UPI00048D8D6D|nr:hypothetical protein [Brackiella oedipodis]